MLLGFKHDPASVVNSIWSKYEPIQQKKLLSDMLNNGEIKADIVKLFFT